MTVKKLFRNIFLTFILSILLTALLYTIWFNTKQRGFEEGQAMTILLIVGALFHNLLLAAAALPALLIAKPSNFENKPARHLLYFGGPVLLTLIYSFFAGVVQLTKLVSYYLVFLLS